MVDLIDRDKIYDILKRFNVMPGSANIRGDGTVDVKGNCFFFDRTNTLPTKFNMIEGDFFIGSCGLTTLKGCPKYVGGMFDCHGNKLTSLEGGPEHVHGHFICNDNDLTSLVGAAKNVETIKCNQNPLQSLDGFPEVNPSNNLMYDGILPWTSTLPLLRLVAVSSVALHDGEKRIGLTDDAYPLYILRKYMKKDKSTLRSRILACQKELIDNGFEGNAKW